MQHTRSRNMRVCVFVCVTKRQHVQSDMCSLTRASHAIPLGRSSIAQPTSQPATTSQSTSTSNRCQSLLDFSYREGCCGCCVSAQFVVNSLELKPGWSGFRVSCQQTNSSRHNHQTTATATTTTPSSIDTSFGCWLLLLESLSSANVTKVQAFWRFGSGFFGACRAP